MFSQAPLHLIWTHIHFEGKTKSTYSIWELTCRWEDLWHFHYVDSEERKLEYWPFLINLVKYLSNVMALTAQMIFKTCTMMVKHWLRLLKCASLSSFRWMRTLKDSNTTENQPSSSRLVLEGNSHETAPTLPNLLRSRQMVPEIDGRLDQHRWYCFSVAPPTCKGPAAGREALVINIYRLFQTHLCEGGISCSSDSAAVVYGSITALIYCIIISSVY